MEKGKEPRKALDKIFKLVDKNLSKLQELEPPKEIIESELFSHQKEGLWWLVHRENSGELPPFWEEKNGYYANMLTNSEAETRPEPLRGGIFADDMGLGKTLTLLSLIAFDKYPTSLPFSIRSSSRNLNKLYKIGKEVSVSGGKRKIEDISLDKDLEEKSSCERKTTLIVCPPSVLSTWTVQLKNHTTSGSFKVYIYYGKRTHNTEELKKYDIVLTTYNTLATEFYSTNSPVKEVNWWRIILDEAHMIKDLTTKKSKAVCCLKANRRWVVTGTPIQNDSLDLLSLMVFLWFLPFSDKYNWQFYVQEPHDKQNETGPSRLQVLMASISLRRTKDKKGIELPPKTVETCYVEFSTKERKVYEQIELKAMRLLESYIDAGSPTHSYSIVLTTILRLRQICSDLSLCPLDTNNFLPVIKFEDASNKPELLQKIVEVLRDEQDLDCPICILPVQNMVITCCGHTFCSDCILKALRHTKSTCPCCRRPLTTSDLFSGTTTPSDANDEVFSSSTTLSSKASALLKLLKSSRDQNSTTKSVVFSQFRKMLILLEKPLKEAGFKVLRLDGSMDAKIRAKVIAEFGVLQTDGATVVLLASLNASGTGTNLTAASRVYLFEPWLNPAVEEQAMDRVHRIGQKKEVKIVRLIVRNSVEEAMLKLQKQKREISNDRRELGVIDLRGLVYR